MASVHEKVVAALKEMREGATEVYLHGNYIGDEGARHLADALKTNSALQTLNLGWNGIGREGARHLADVLETNSALQTLHLSMNSVGAEGARHLADALKTNTMLRSLSLVGNNIGVKGARHLADALKTNSTLQWLDLKNNRIGAKGARHLSEALKTNSTLQTLLLYGNRIGAEGARHLADALKTNSTLQTLDLSANSIGDEGARALLEALDANETLLELEVESNDIPAELEAQLMERVKGAPAMLKKSKAEFGRKGLEALERNEKVRWGRAKLMIVGQGAAGKSSLVRSMLAQEPVLKHDSTIGVDLTPRVDVTLTEVQVGGDVVEVESFEHVAVQSAQLGRQMAKQQFGRKSLGKRMQAVPRKGIKSFKALLSFPAKQVKADKTEMAGAYSTKLRTNVQRRGSRVDEEIGFTIWDYGGQEVFYALHHLFLTKYGVYVVVFDMRELLGKERLKEQLTDQEFEDLVTVEEAVATLRFWLDSIKLHAEDASIVLVGTRMNAVSSMENLEYIHGMLETDIDVSAYQIERNHGARLWFFPVDNNERGDMRNVQAIQAAVVAGVRGKAFLDEEVPLRWTYVLDKLLEDETRFHMTLAEVKAFALDLCKLSGEEVETKMLPYLHQLGVLVHLTSTPVLANVVVLRPQWLLRNLARVICDPRHMETHKKALLHDELLPAELVQPLRRWEHEGVAERQLLEWLWRGEDADYFVSLMEEMLLASPYGEGGALLVPSLLPPIDVSDLAQLRTSFGDGVLCYVQFDFLPKGLFQRFVCGLRVRLGELVSFIQAARRTMAVFADAALINFDGAEVLLEADVATRRVRMRFLRDDADGVADRLQLVLSNMDMVDDSFMNGRLAPRLVLSSDGSDDISACALFEQVVAFKASGKGRMLSNRSIRAEDFALLIRAGVAERNMGSAAEARFDAFLSHDWGAEKVTHKLVVRIAKALEKCGISCWLDENEIEGSVVRSMAQGIDQSRTSVVFVTRNYMDKVNGGGDKGEHDNCLREFNYIAKVHGLSGTVPAVLESGMCDTRMWRGDFGMLLPGDPLFVPLIDAETDFDGAVARLATAIHAKVAAATQAAQLRRQRSQRT